MYKKCFLTCKVHINWTCMIATLQILQDVTASDVGFYEKTKCELTLLLVQSSHSLNNKKNICLSRKLFYSVRKPHSVNKSWELSSISDTISGTVNLSLVYLTWSLFHKKTACRPLVWVESAKMLALSTHVMLAAPLCLTLLLNWCLKCWFKIVIYKSCTVCLARVVSSF